MEVGSFPPVAGESRGLLKAVEPLEVDRRLLAGRGVSPTGFVEALDGVEDLGLGPKPLQVEELALEHGEEALAERVVARVTDRPMEGRTLTSLERMPNAMGVYRVLWSEW